MEPNLYCVSWSRLSYAERYHGLVGVAPPLCSAITSTFFLCSMSWRSVGAGAPGVQV